MYIAKEARSLVSAHLEKCIDSGRYCLEDLANAASRNAQAKEEIIAATVQQLRQEVAFPIIFKY